MKLNIFKLLIILIFFYGCKKNQVYNVENLPENIHSLFYDSTAEYDGYFTFEESRSIASQQADAFFAQLSGAYRNSNGSIELSTDAKLFVNNYETLPELNEYHKHFDSSECATFVGRNFNLSSVNESDTNSFANFNTSIYFPPVIHFNFPEYVPMGTDSLEMIQGSTLLAGQTLTWNADHNNNLGVTIALEYEHFRDYNTLVRRKGANTSAANYVIVPDNGSYILTNELVEDMPEGGVVELTIMRGNIVPYSLPKDTAKKIKIMVSTTEKGLFKFSYGN